MSNTITHQTWLERRLGGIGASDAPVILGQSSFKSPYELWAEKCGLIEPDDISELERIKWGHRLQRPIGEAFREETGRPVVHCDPFDTRQHPDIEWQLCTPDCIEDDPATRGDLPGALEIKNVDKHNAKEWEEEAPLQYQVQLQHQLAVTGMHWGTVCALIGGNRLKWFDIDRNDRFIEIMTFEEAKFWDLVQRREPPQGDYANRHMAKVLAKLHPEDSGETIVLPDEATAWDAELGCVKDKIKLLEEMETALTNRLKEAIGGATYGMLPTGGKWSWKTQTRKGYTVQESTCRILRRTKG